jgi:NifU-like protein
MAPVYPDKVSKRCWSPKFTGQVSRADAEGVAVAIECGTYVRFRIDVTDGTVAGASFASNGCGFMMAAADTLAEYLQDKQLIELHGLDTNELMSVVITGTDLLPPDRKHCAATVVDAVREAFAAYRRSRLEEFRGDRALICTCFGISEDTIENIIRERGAVTTDEISRLTNAGRGCGSCRILLQEMIDSAAL